MAEAQIAMTASSNPIATSVMFSALACYTNNIMSNFRQTVKRQAIFISLNMICISRSHFAFNVVTTLINSNIGSNPSKNYQYPTEQSRYDRHDHVPYKLEIIKYHLIKGDDTIR